MLHWRWRRTSVRKHLIYWHIGRNIQQSCSPKSTQRVQSMCVWGRDHPCVDDAEAHGFCPAIPPSRGQGMLQQPMQQVPQGRLAETGRFGRTTSTGVRRRGARVMEGAGAVEGGRRRERHRQSQAPSQRRRCAQATTIAGDFVRETKPNSRRHRGLAVGRRRGLSG